MLFWNEFISLERDLKKNCCELLSASVCVGMFPVLFSGMGLLNFVMRLTL